MDNLDSLRLRINRPLYVLSAYRSVYHNASVGGSARSMHLEGMAVDISIVNSDKYSLKTVAKAVGFTGFGHYNTFLHIDIGRPRKWGKWDA
jgi:zinc D-Ala-D-Ala carboxypeptidase